MSDQPFFETSDTFLASFLLTRKIPYRGCYEQTDNVVAFRFQKRDRISDLIDEFSFDAECPAKSLLSNYRFLVNQTKQARRNGGGQ
jgi:hypothetical protein